MKVAVFEAETFGWGASSRNGGMVLTGMKLPVPTLIKRYGRDTVRKMYAASLESIDCVEHIVREENIDCNFSRCGHLEVACKQAHFDGYKESAALIKREFNHELLIIPKNELRAEIGSDMYFGGMVDETSAGLNPARYLAGLALAARRAEACLFDQTRVTSVGREINNGAGKFRVQTSRGAITAREVILASGAYTTDATPALRKKIIPIGSYIIATEVLPAEDRKSTRLNSSHQIISYAVFCLKKKKTRSDPAVATPPASSTSHQSQYQRTGRGQLGRETQRGSGLDCPTLASTGYAATMLDSCPRMPLPASRPLCHLHTINTV